jgi:hypothetical protein
VVKTPAAAPHRGARIELITGKSFLLHKLETAAPRTNTPSTDISGYFETENVIATPITRGTYNNISSNRWINIGWSNQNAKAVL